MEEWFEERLRLDMGASARLFDSEAHHAVLRRFLTGRDAKGRGCRSMFAWLAREDRVSLSHCPPAEALDTCMCGEQDGTVVYFLAAQDAPLASAAELSEHVSYGTLALKKGRQGILRSLSGLVGSRLEPILQRASLPKSEQPVFTKKGIRSGMMTFLLAIYDGVSVETNRTRIFVPSVVPSVAAFRADAELTKDFEAVLLHWTRQIRETMAQDGPEAIDMMPLERIAFWESRATDYSFLAAQLQSSAVLACIGALRSNQSQYLSRFDDLRSEIIEASHQAETNLRFLSILQEPCAAIAATPVDSLPDCYDDLLSRVRLIWRHCPYYRSQERLQHLLKSISAALISRCREPIATADVFSSAGPIAPVLSSLAAAVGACEAWLEAFNAMRRRVIANEVDGELWHTERSTTFAHVKTFIQVCQNLLEVCEGQRQYGRRPLHTESPVDRRGRVPLPHCGDTKGNDSTKVGLLAIEVLFCEAVEDLRDLPYDVLDVLKAPLWYHKFSALKATLTELDSRLTTLLSNRTSEAKGQTISSLVDILASFTAVSVRPVVHATLKKQTTEVCRLHLESITRLRSRFERHRALSERSSVATGNSSSDVAPYCFRPDMPPHAGAAFWALQIINLAESGWLSIRDAMDAGRIPYTERVADVEAAVGELRGLLRNYVRNVHSRFVSSAAALFGNEKVVAKLDVPIIAQSAVPRDRIEVNFPPGIIALVHEAYNWRRLGPSFAPPFVAHDIMQMWERSGSTPGLRLLHGHVSDLVRAFNDVKGELELGASGASGRRRSRVSITERDEEDQTRHVQVNACLFRELVHKLEAKIRPGFARLTWLHPRHIERFCRVGAAISMGVLGMVRKAHRTEKAIAALARELGDIQLIHISVNETQSPLRFHAQQTKHLARHRSEIARIAHEIRNHVYGELWPIFSGTAPGSAVRMEWTRLIARLNAMIGKALRRCIRSSIAKFARMVVAEPKVDTVQIFSLDLVLAPNGRMAYFPTVGEAVRTIASTLRSIFRMLLVVPRLVEPWSPSILHMKEPSLYSSVAGEAAASLDEGDLSILDADSILTGTEGSSVGFGVEHADSSFFNELTADPDFIQPALNVVEEATTMATRLQDHLKDWDGKYPKAFRVNDEEKVASLLRRYGKRTTRLLDVQRDIDERIQTHDQIQAERASYEIGSIKANAVSLIGQLGSHALSWIERLCELVHQEGRELLMTVISKLDDTEHDLRATPATVEDLRRLFERHAAAKAEAEEIEGSFDDLYLRYCLTIYHHPSIVSSEEVETLSGLLGRTFSMRSDVDDDGKELERHLSLHEEGDAARFEGDRWLEYHFFLNDKFHELRRVKEAMRNVLHRECEKHRVETVAVHEALKREYPLFFEVGPSEAKRFLSKMAGALERTQHAEERLNRDLDFMHEAALAIPATLAMQEDLAALRAIWGLVGEWIDFRQQILSTAFYALDLSDMEATVQRTKKELLQMRSRRDVTHWPVYVHTKQLLVAFANALELVKGLRSEHLRPRHWHQLGQEVGHAIDPGHPDFTLEKLLNLDLEKRGDFVQSLTHKAKKELQVGSSIDEIASRWTVLSLSWGASTYPPLLADVPLLTSIVEEDQLQLDSLKRSRFAIPFAVQVSTWDAKLRAISSSLDFFVVLQKEFLQLRSIFASSDALRKQLPREAALYDRCVSRFSTICGALKNDQKVHVAFTRPALLGRLEELEELLSQVQRGLENFLEVKRMKWPRLFFVSNADLLHMMAHAREPIKLQRHLNKCFTGIATLELDFRSRNEDSAEDVDRLEGDAESSILGMVSRGDTIESLTVAFVKGVYSDLREHVVLQKPLICSGSVELWMKDLEAGVGHAVRISYTRALAYHKSNREAWINRFPAQALLLASHTIFTWEVERALARRSGGHGHEEGVKQRMRELKRKWMSLLTKLSGLAIRASSALRRAKLSALLISELHARDVLEGLVKNKVAFSQDFQWQMQMRSYFVKNGVVPGASAHVTAAATQALSFIQVENSASQHRPMDLPPAGEESGSDLRSLNEKALESFANDAEVSGIQIRHASVPLEYSWEYQGNLGRLVITPITDRCMLTLSTALHLKRGASPLGPAGTGKTETIKLHAQCLGRFFTSLTGSDGVDQSSTGRMLSGTVMCGSFVCFDEINRIEGEVLSVVAQQILAVVNAVSASASTFNFQGRVTPCNPRCGVFVTFNPTYAGRTELPDNLKALLRPCAMMRADVAQIAEVMLQTEGFRHARVLARKVDAFFEHLGKRLSRADHYYFGLRSVKPALAAAAAEMRCLQRRVASEKEDGAAKIHSLPQELHLLAAGLERVLKPMLVAADEAPFSELLANVFPGDVYDRPSTDSWDDRAQRALLEALQQEMTHMKLHQDAKTVQKALQLWECQKLRHSSMLVGPSLSGKSAVAALLRRALKRLAAECKQRIALLDDAQSSFEGSLRASQGQRGGVGTPGRRFDTASVASEESGFGRAIRGQRRRSSHLTGSVVNGSAGARRASVARSRVGGGWAGTGVDSQTISNRLASDRLSVEGSSNAFGADADELEPLFWPSLSHQVINAKSISTSELFGFFDAKTSEWQYGVLPRVFRQLSAPPVKGSGADVCDDAASVLGSSAESERHEVTDDPAPSSESSWICFDCPVDPSWVESLNSLMDDNKILSLPNGDSLRMPKKMLLLFEAEHLQQASPATVSRASMVYTSPDTVPWRSFVASWLERAVPLHDAKCGRDREMMTALFDKYVPRVVHWHEQRFQGKDRGSYLPCRTVRIRAMLRTLVDMLEILVLRGSGRAFDGGGRRDVNDAAVTSMNMAGAARSAPRKSDLVSYRSRLNARRKSSLSTPTEASRAFSQAATVLSAHANRESVRNPAWQHVLGSNFAGAFRNVGATDRLRAAAHVVGAEAMLNEQALLTSIPEHRDEGKAAASLAEDEEIDAQMPWRSLLRTNDAVMVEDKDLAQRSYQEAAERWFLFCTAWAFGGMLSREDRSAFDAFLRELEHGVLPTALTVFDYYVDPDSAFFKPWTDRLPHQGIFRAVGDRVLSSMTAPTVETVRLGYTVRKLSLGGGMPLLVAPCGYGKGSIARHELKQLSDDDFAKTEIAFTAMTTSRSLQSCIEARMEKKSASRIGPRSGKAGVVVFLNDIALPRPDEYGGQEALELLRFWADYAALYDRKKFRKVQVLGLHVMATTTMDGSHARQAFPARLASKFSALRVEDLAKTTVQRIFEARLLSRLSNFGVDVRRMIEPLISSTFNICKAAQAKFRPSPACPHYSFGLQHIDRVMRSLFAADPSFVHGKDGILRLWVHEVLRVIGDGLGKATHRTTLQRLLEKELSSRFQISWTALLSDLHEGGSACEGPVFCPLFEAPTARVERSPAVRRGLTRGDTFDSDASSFDVTSLADDLTLGTDDSDDVAFPYAEVMGYHQREDFKDVLDAWAADLDASDVSTAGAHCTVLFQSAIIHLVKLLRAFRPGCCETMLLVGVRGSGRRTLVRLAAHIWNVQLNVPEVSSSNTGTVDEFREDLKRALRHAGIERRQNVFLCSDQVLKVEEICAVVHELMTIGSVAFLWNAQETSEIVDAMLRKAGSKRSQRLARADSERIMRTFHARAMQRLHLVVCVSPVGSAFKALVSNYPGFAHRTTVDWYHAWPAEGLCSVAKHILSSEHVLPASVIDVDDGHSISTYSSSTDMQQQIADISTEIHGAAVQASEELIHQRGDRVYVTSPTFIDLLETFRSVFGEKQGELLTLRRRLEMGLHKLDVAKLGLEEMSRALEQSKLQLEEKQRECDALLISLSEKRRLAEERRLEAESDSAAIAEEERDVQRLTLDAQQDLDTAEPALRRAMEIVEKLPAAAISEIRTFQAPKQLVVDVLVCLMHFLGDQPSWQAAKRRLGDATFINQLKSFDKDGITDGQLSRIRRITKQRAFTIENVSRQSRAAAALCGWVLAMEDYALVYRHVAPKRAKLRSLHKRLSKKRTELLRAQERLVDIQAQVNELEKSYAESTNEKTALQIDLDATTHKIQRAMQLVSGLSNEQVRWAERKANAQASLETLTGDSLMAAACLAYAGPLPARNRTSVAKAWQQAIVRGGLRCRLDFNLGRFVTDMSQRNKWRAHGLPEDNFLIEGATIVMQSRRYALITDPDGQANRWLRSLERARGLEIYGGSSRRSDHASRSLLSLVEECVSSGKPLLVEDVSEGLEIYHELLPLLEFYTRHSSPAAWQSRPLLYLGGTATPVRDGFRLYLTSRLRNPHFLPDVQTHLTVVNFVLAEGGLREQLLSVVVEMERPEIEARRVELMHKTIWAQERINEVENAILEHLNTSKGILVEDEKLIDAVKNSKGAAEEAEASLVETMRTEDAINDERTSYAAVARRAAWMYFALDAMASLNSMYRYGVESYIDVFRRSVIQARAMHAQVVVEGNVRKGRRDSFEDTRLKTETILNVHTYSAFLYGTRSLFQDHRALFSLRIACGVLHERGKLNVHEYTFLLRGGRTIERGDRRPNPAPEWIQEPAWDDLSELEKISQSAFGSFCTIFEQHLQDWELWFMSEAPEISPLPGRWESKCDLLQRLLLLRCLRPDRLLQGVRRFVTTVLDDRFVSSPPLNLAELAAASSSTTPLMFILSPGVDPTTKLLEVCERQQVGLLTVSLGQGQQQVAEKQLDVACRTGSHLLLSNLHLMTAWLPELERWIRELEVSESAGASRTHPHFRLWLSTAPKEHFSPLLLQCCVKLTTEPPRGLRASMSHLYAFAVDSGRYESVSQRPDVGVQYQRLVFSLAWLHSLLVERRKFKALGWVDTYAYSEMDFATGSDLIVDFLEDLSDPTLGLGPWKALRYLIGEITYGGRVTDAADRQLLGLYCRELFSPQMMDIMAARLVAAEDLPSASARIGQDLNGESMEAGRGHDLTVLAQYLVPNCPTVAGALDAIEDLPMEDPPEAFGQHRNAQVASEREDAWRFLSAASTVETSAVHRTGVDDDQTACLVTAAMSSTVNRHTTYLETRLLHIDSALPSLADVDQSLESLAKHDPATKSVIEEELQFVAAHLTAMRRSVRLAVAVLRGEEPPTDSTQRLLDDIETGAVPSEWLSPEVRAAYPFSTLAPWIHEFKRRAAFLTEWCDRGRPREIWLGAFLWPERILAALKQSAAKTLGFAMDNCRWSAKVVGSTAASGLWGGSTSFLVQGLILEGAGWEGGAGAGMGLVRPKAMQFNTYLPTVQVSLVPITGEAPGDGEEPAVGVRYYQCPVYRSSERLAAPERDVRVLQIALPCAMLSPESAMKRGVALVLSAPEVA